MILFGAHVYLTYCSEIIPFEPKSTKQLMIIVKFSFRLTGGEFYTTEQLQSIQPDSVPPELYLQWTVREWTEAGCLNWRGRDDNSEREAVGDGGT